jgi:hypothetical protein
MTAATAARDCAARRRARARRARLTRWLVTAVLSAALVRFAPGAEGPAAHARARLAGWQNGVVCAWIEAIDAMRGDEPPACTR